MGILRKTKSVATVLHAFDKSQDALSVVDLVDKLHAEMNKTTVYRILDRLEQDGVLHSFLGRDGLKWYAKCAACTSTHHEDAHPHFQCQDCGKVECLSMPVSIPAVSNHKIYSADLLLIGQCADCISV